MASAHNEVQKALYKGILHRDAECNLCGAHEKKTGWWGNFYIVAHHWRGYEYPLDVWWICRRCNRLLAHRHDETLTIKQAKDIVFSA